jgi:hypothetical protein
MTYQVLPIDDDISGGSASTSGNPSMAKPLAVFYDADVYNVDWLTPQPTMGRCGVRRVEPRCVALERSVYLSYLAVAAFR